MKLKKLAVGLAAVASLAAPLTLAGPAEAHSNKTPCVRITAPASHTVKTGETVTIHVRVSEECRKAKVTYNGMPAHRMPGRHLVIDTAYLLPGEKTITVKVDPPKGEGKAVTKSITYLVVAQ